MSDLRLPSKLLTTFVPLLAATFAQAEQLISCPLKYGFVNVALTSGSPDSARAAGVQMCTTPANDRTMAADCRNFQAEAVFENKNKLTVCATPDRALCIVIDRTNPDVPLVVVHVLADKDNKVSPDGTRKVLLMQSKCYLYQLRESATDGVMTW